jgi:hypothetical protein
MGRYAAILILRDREKPRFTKKLPDNNQHVGPWPKPGPEGEVVSAPHDRSRRTGEGVS